MFVDGSIVDWSVTAVEYEFLYKYRLDSDDLQVMSHANGSGGSMTVRPAPKQADSYEFEWDVLTASGWNLETFLSQR